MITEKKYFASDVEINYASTSKTGPPLVLLHGTANRWQAFLPIIPLLSDRWQVFALDFRGHGGSQHVESYGFGYYYEDTIEFLKGVVDEPAVIFGHSLWGRVATKMAAEYPYLVRAIILGDSSLKEPEPSDRMGKSFLSLVKLIEEEKTCQKIYASLKRQEGEKFDPVYGLVRAKNLSLLDTRLLKSIAEHGMDLKSPGNHFYGYHPVEHMKKIKCPVLLLQAEYGMLSEEEIEMAQELMPEVYHVRLAGVPHEFLYRPIEPLVKALYAFLEAV